MNPANRQIRRGLTVLLLLYPSIMNAAFEFHPVGAQAAGAGDVGVAQISSSEGLFWNPAAVVFGKPLSVFASYDRPFGLSALETQALAASLRWGRHGLGGTYQGFGFDLYREQVFGIVYGLRLAQRVGLGIQVRSLAVTIKNIPPQRWLVFDLGLRIQVHPTLFMALTAWNAGGMHTGILGQGGAWGLHTLPTPETDLVIALQKEAGLPTGFGFGLQHRVLPVFILRFGAGTQPERLSAGLGLHRGLIHLDYAAIYHTVLGLSHRVSLTIEP